MVIGGGVIVGVLALLSLLVPAAPDYDAWAYLTWGREVSHLELSTESGPAFKPLPVAICALLAPLGSAAPDAWLVVVRMGALAAILLAAIVAADIVRERTRAGVAALKTGQDGGPEPESRMRGPGHVLGLLAGIAAGIGVAFTGGFIRHAMGGDAEPLLVAFALGAWQRHHAGRRDQALVLALMAALVRVEAWPFVAAYALAVIGWRRAVLLAAGVLAAWFGPELAGSGELLRSGERASVPNPGAPATADIPFLASLGDAAALLPLPLALAAPMALAVRRGHLALLAGLAWCLLVAVMAELGFSGEARYAMPGVALVAVGAAIGLAAPSGRARVAAGAAGRARVVALALGFIVVAATTALGVREQDELRASLAYRDQLVNDLGSVIGEAGGRDALLACGRPAVGRYRGTMAAYALDVPKERVRADGLPDAVTLRSRLGPRDALEPMSPGGGRLAASNDRWRLVLRCARE